MNLYHLFGTLRYGEVIGDKIVFDHAFINGGHFLPLSVGDYLKPIFEVKKGVFPTPEEWHRFLKSYPGR